MQFIYKLFTGVLLVFFGVTVLHAQNPVHRLLSSADGIPSNTVYNCLQDSKGYVWIGHDKGMSRYDGKQFKHYAATAKQGRSLSNIIELNGVVWCQDFSGNHYYVSGDTLLHEMRLPATTFFSPAVAVGKYMLAMIDASKFTGLNLQTGELTSIPVGGKFSGFGLATEKNEAYAFISGYLYKFSENGYQRLQQITNANQSFFHLKKIGNRFLLFTKDIYPYVYEVVGSQVVAIPNILPRNTFIQDVNWVNNELWVCTSSGAYCFDEQLRPKYGGKVFFQENSITHVMLDEEGSYWFCTINKGIMLVSNIHSTVVPYGEEVFTTMATSDDALLLGTNTHKILSYNQGKFKPLLQLPNNQEITDILVNNKQKLLVTSSSLVNVYNQNKLVSSISLAGKKSLLLNESTVITAFSSGVRLFSAKPNTPVSFPKWLVNTPFAKVDRGVQYLFADIRCRYISLRSSDSTLFIASGKGLFYISPKGWGSIEYEQKPIYASQLLVHNNQLFVGTYNDGLYIIENKQVKNHYSFVNNKIANAIYKLKEHGNYLWMIGDEQLVKMNFETQKISYLTSSNGLPKAEIKDIAFQNKQLFVATTAGLIVLPEESTAIGLVPPKIYVNKVAANGAPIQWKNDTTLSTSINNLQFSFSIISFTGDDKQLLQYRVNNTEWISIEASARTLSLPKLAPGKYTIEVKAYNNAGIVSANNVLLIFTIATPFYQTIWFFIAAILAVTSLVYWYFTWQLRGVKASNKLLSEKISLENALHKSVLASIKSQMNPHFIFNALNTIQAYIYTSDKKNASTYLSKFSALTRIILDMSNKDVVSLSEEIRALQLYLELEQLRFEDKLTYTIITDESLLPESVLLPSMLIQPYVENAIKHGLLHSKNMWKLSIEFTSTPTGILVSIDDNGIGRERSMQLNKQRPDKHTSFAAKANATRLELLNRGLNESISLSIMDKYDGNGHPIGTKVFLNIPNNLGKVTALQQR